MNGDQVDSKTFTYTDLSLLAIFLSTLSVQPQDTDLLLHGSTSTLSLWHQRPEAWAPEHAGTTEASFHTLYHQLSPMCPHTGTRVRARHYSRDKTWCLRSFYTLNVEKAKETDQRSRVEQSMLTHSPVPSRYHPQRAIHGQHQALSTGIPSCDCFHESSLDPVTGHSSSKLTYPT